MFFDKDVDNSNLPIPLKTSTGFDDKDSIYLSVNGQAIDNNADRHLQKFPPNTLDNHPANAD
ncbi:hypothetical protein SGADD02_00936 [Streptococcus gallolyticus]|uniref:Uncharacterized protein n=1 Tax=Streptococcus gallolyticus TaxID=315405 RepID=A0A139N1L4_9STRE|nr:hypothetical protein SGADD02_00936 [Streptococcus gallolyticus]